MCIKLTALIVFTSFMHLNAAVFSQNINITEKNVSLTTVFNQLEKQTGYTFFYKTSIIKSLPPVDIDVHNSTLEHVLNVAFASSGLTYTIVDRTVVVKEPMVKAISTSQIISGKVTDAKGVPLPGVTIKLKGTNILYVSDNKGEFTGSITETEGILQFSYIGYVTQEIFLKNIKGPLNIILQENTNALDQVQVVAYGTTTKRLTTGDQTTISAAEIAKYPTKNVLDVLQGNVPGLTVYKNTGNANSSYKVQLRGINGVNGRPPLYVVNGIPYESGGYTTLNTTLGGSSANGTIGQGNDALNFINPEDIESITVLKDASATAIYGTRAADGVIIITTKKGKPNSGGPKVDVNVYSGFTQVTHFPQLLDLQQYLQMRKEAKRNDNTAIGATDYDINGVWDATRSTNWAKALLGGTGHFTNVQTAVSGGNNNTQYRISAGYNKQTNVADLDGSDQSANLSFNITSKSDDNKFSVQLDGGYFYNINTITQNDLINSITMAPDAPAIYDGNGGLNFQNNTFSNPFVVKYLLNHTTGTNLISSSAISYRPVTGLEFKATLGYNKQQVDEFLGTPSTATPPFLTQTPFSNFTNSSKSWWSIEPQINYHTDISKGKLAILVGGSLQKAIQEGTQLKVTGYSSDLLLPSISGGTSVTNLSGYVYSPYKLSSLFGRASYNWDNKYLLDVSGRYDGSSHFGPNKQFHVFGAVGAAWIFSEENLIKNHLTFLSYGKLRASYGVTGRDNIQPYQYLGTYSSTTLPYNTVAGLIPTALANRDLSWESTEKGEISLELQFLKGRIAVETNFYRNRTSNILNGYMLSAVTGFSTIQQNLPAVIQNEGIDLSITGQNISTKDFTWSTTLLFTRERNKLLSYPGLAQSSYANQYVIGKPVNIIHAYNFDGVNPQTGFYQFKAKSGADVTSPVFGTDNYELIDINPDFYGSLQNSFRYKQFTLSFMFRFIKQIGKNAFGQQYPTAVPGLNANVNVSTLFLSRWQKPGDITDIQRYGTNFSLLSTQSTALKSNNAYGDASYIRFQNLSFAYSLPQSLIKKLHVSNLQVYVQGENLLTISSYGAIDPENQSSTTLPPLRTVTTGLRLSL